MLSPPPTPLLSHSLSHSHMQTSVLPPDNSLSHSHKCHVLIVRFQSLSISRTTVICIVNIPCTSHTFSPKHCRSCVGIGWRWITVSQRRTAPTSGPPPQLAPPCLSIHSRCSCSPLHWTPETTIVCVETKRWRRTTSGHDDIMANVCSCGGRHHYQPPTPSPKTFSSLPSPVQRF